MEEEEDEAESDGILDAEARATAFADVDLAGTAFASGGVTLVRTFFFAGADVEEQAAADAALGEDAVDNEADEADD